MTSPSSQSSSTTNSAATAASTTASSTTATASAASSSAYTTSEDFVTQQQGALSENEDHLAYYDYVTIRVAQIMDELDPSGPDALIVDTLRIPYAEDLVELRHLQAVHREAFKAYFAGEYASDAEESAMRTRIRDNVYDFKTFEVFFRREMNPLLALVTKMDLIEHDRMVSSIKKPKAHQKPKAKVQSAGDGGGYQWCKFGSILTLAILILMVIWYSSGGDTTTPKGERETGSDRTTHAQWITTIAVSSTSGPSYDPEPTYGPNEPTLGPNDLTYGSDESSYGPYGPRLVPKDRSLMNYEEDDPAAPILESRSKQNFVRSPAKVRLIRSILIGLLVTVSVVILLGLVAYYRFAAATTSGDGSSTPGGGGQESLDLESGCKTDSRDTDAQESAADLES